MAINFVTGCEDRVVGIGQNLGAAAAWSGVNGTPEAYATTKRTGDYSFRFLRSTGGTVYLTKNNTNARIVWSGYLYIVTGLSTTSRLLIFNTAAGDPEVVITSGHQVQIRAINTNTLVSVGSALSTGQWYRLDVEVVLSGSAATITARIDGGTDATDTDNTNASAAFASWSMGIITTATGEVLFDDIVTGDAAADYDLGAHYVKGYKVSADGTHNFASGDITDGTNPINTDLYALIDDLPGDGDSDRLELQSGLSSTEYAEFAITDSVETDDIQAVALTIRGESDTGGAPTDKVSLRVYDSGGSNFLTPITDQDVSVTADTAGYAYGLMLLAPGSVAWTVTNFNSAKLRLNSSWTTPDVDPIPQLFGLAFQVLYTPAATQVEEPTLDLDSASGHTFSPDLEIIGPLELETASALAADPLLVFVLLLTLSTETNLGLSGDEVSAVAPSGLRATVSPGPPLQVNLYWSGAGIADETGFSIQRRDVTLGGAFAEIDTVGPNVEEYLGDTGPPFVAKHRYAYRIAVIGGTSDGLTSNVVAVLGGTGLLRKLKRIRYFN